VIPWLLTGICCSRVNLCRYSPAQEKSMMEQYNEVGAVQVESSCDP
jgi:hypothetical protein